MLVWRTLCIATSTAPRHGAYTEIWLSALQRGTSLPICVGGWGSGDSSIRSSDLSSGSHRVRKCLVSSRSHQDVMKVTIALGWLAFSLVVRHARGQQSCYCSSIDCSCANSTSDAVSGDAVSSGNLPVGSRNFLTPTGDYQSPSTSAKPVRAVNRQQYIWVGASMISSSSNAIVLVRATVAWWHSFCSPSMCRRPTQL